jgi:hypothetical protein
MLPDWTKQYALARPLDDGTYLVVMPLTFGRARVAIAPDRWSLGEHW